MKKFFTNLLILLILLINGYISHGQWQYQPLESKKEVPQLVYRDFFEVAMEDLSTRMARTSGKITNKERDFLKQNAYVMHKLFSSGFILSGDTISVYCRKILKELLKDDPKLFNSINIYTVLSPQVNAFMTYGGNMFIYVGLIARMDNEAQLASVLAHEIIHYKKDHIFKTFREYQKAKKDVKIFRPTKAEEIEKRMLSYSKENEFEADLDGVEMLAAADYDPYQMITLMDKLLYGYLPFDDREYFYTHLEIGRLKIPLYMQVKKYNPITKEEDVDDSQNTHPSAFKRKERLTEKIKSFQTKEYKTFKNDENTFKYIKKIATYELCNIYLLNTAYDRALYNSYLLNDEQASDEFLITTTAKALHGIFTYKLHNKTSEIL